MNDDPDDLADRIRRYAERHDTDAPAVIGHFDALTPADLEDVRALLETGLNQQDGGGDVPVLVNDESEPITEADRTDAIDPVKNLSDEKSRELNTGDGDGFDEDTDASGDLDTQINSIIRPGKVPTDDADPVEEDTPGEIPTLEGGFTDANPTFDAEKTVGEEALGDALEWYHDQLDRELPEDVTHDTARDYYRARGWSDETIDAKLLGYAPANHKDALIAYLFDRGHDRDAILATGLFGERDDGNLYATWSGRYVLPYLDETGEGVYAISRATDPVHPADWKGNKYDKLQVTREDVTVKEPIYGLDTVRESEPVLITEGIADAITAHQAGYPCLSPVTVQFKDRDREKLLEALETRHVERVYLIQDAERPTSSVDDRDRLTLQQFGDGVKGAVKTAAYLSNHGLEARVADLPRPGLDKVDLDDYLRDWSDDLTPLLAGSKPVECHPAYDDTTARDAALDAAGASDLSRDTIDGSGEYSALYDLGVRDVTGLSWDYRGKNPLGHHGDSETYFVLLENHGVGYDHKYKVAYNALTYLLVDAGERRPGSPNGSLDDREIFAAWKHAKRERLIPEADPIPHRALQYVARDHDLVETADIIDGWKLPRDVYNVALNIVREEHGVEPGRHPIGIPEDAEPVAPIAFAKLDALSGTDRARYARKRGFDIPSTDEAREALRDTLFRELRAENTTTIDAPTALGKSHTTATTPWLDYLDTTGGAPVIHLHATKDARDEAAKKTQQSTATGAVLKGRKEKSPLARGDHDPVEDPDTDAEEPDLVVTIDGKPASKWFDLMCDEKGLPFSTALSIAKDRNDQDLEELPPIGAEDPAVAQWDGLPRDDDGDPAVDVIHATHQFGYVPSLRAYTNVIIDEQPDFTVDVTQDRIRRMVNAYLRAIDAPVTTWEQFVTLAKYEYDGYRSDAANERDALDDKIGREPPVNWYADDPDAHALAPDLTKAIWFALKHEEPNENGRRNWKVFHEPPRLDAGEEKGYAGTWLSVVIDDENTVRTVRSTPDFTQARAVIGLDAHPSMPMWELNGAPGMKRDAVLDPVRRRLWRRYERGLTTVQLGDGTRPRSGPNAREWMNDERVRTVLKKLRERYGDGFGTFATTRQVESAVRQILEDVTGEDLDDEHTLHFGEEKSRNPEAFVDAIAGYVYGCMDPGDGMILDALAELDLEAKPGMVETEEGEIKREKGRTFEGPDADTADALLASVRENHVAQAAGRYARNPDNPESSAVVYVHTDAAPEGFIDLQVPGVEWIASDLQREIIDELAKRPEATTRELANAVDCDKEHARKTLQRLGDEGLVERDEHTGKHGADVYRDAGGEEAIVDLGETTNEGLKDFSRWSLAVCQVHGDAGENDPVDAGSNGGENRSAIATGWNDPPNPGD